MSDLVALLVIALGVVVLVGLIFGLMYLDARSFAEECLRAGGTVVAPRVCIPAA